MNSLFKSVLVIVFLAFAMPVWAQYTIGDGFGPQLIRRVEPDFPAEVLAKVYGSGTIRLFVEIDQSGNVWNVEGSAPWVTCGFFDPQAEALKNAAIKAAMQSVFIPKSRDGQPVNSAFILTYNFESRRLEHSPQNPTPNPTPVTSPTPANAAPTPGSGPGGIVNGKAISLPKPEYPARARQLKIGTPVSVEVFIDENGTIIQATPRSGHPLLLDSAANAACHARFSPTLLSGMPVKVTGVITYNFVL